MPSSPVHLRLAQLCYEKLGISDVPAFMLGSIAPDCVNYGLEQASEKIRYTAHIRSRDYEEWKTMLRSFYRENKDSFRGPKDLLRGYLFHIWADIAWDETVQPALFEFLGTLGYGYDDMTGQKWQELYRFNSFVMKQDYYPWCQEQLRQAVRLECSSEIAGCSPELMDKYAMYVADDYKDKIIDSPALFLTEEHITSTADYIFQKGYFAQE